MSGRLDQSLDSIIDSQKKAKRDNQRRRKPVGVKARAAPVGGVKKATKPAKSAVKPAGGASASAQPSKIVVSGLPYDVNEAQIKEYFSKSVGQVKKVSLQYNQNGQSRGIADISFNKPGVAAKAAKELNGMLVDKRPMKIEVVVEASSVTVPEAKPLSERVAYANPKHNSKSGPLMQDSANPKAKPKSATATKATAKDGAKGRKANTNKKTRTQRSKPKTAEELDAEMTDYFNANNNAAAPAQGVAANGAAATAAPAAADDMGMDEIS